MTDLKLMAVCFFQPQNVSQIRSSPSMAVGCCHVIVKRLPHDHYLV